MSGYALATVIGVLFALGTFLILRRDLLRVVWGITLYSQAANVYLMTMGGITAPGSEVVPVLAHHGGEVPETTDPLVQALVLTAIVISFGMTAFALVLSFRVYEENATIDVSDLGGER
ncbi:sodium:proton antiporter [Halalkalicoccus ordinarius]|uniref:sodium:proton antiporter n=1 Tax=Halalkalicoccus ordinarius TaxID=3116651 RepID=UPI00300E8E66